MIVQTKRQKSQNEVQVNTSTANRRKEKDELNDKNSACTKLG